MTKALVGAAAVSLMLASCATTPIAPEKSWVAVRRTDPFTDQVSCRVAPPDEPLSVFAPVQLVYYPFVEKRGGTVRVGLISGGRFRIPVGRVQLRVDDKSAWSIDTSETPLDMIDAAPSAPIAAMAANQSPAVRDAMLQAAKVTTTSISQISSPFTATTGGKAAKILDEMKHGHEIIYQTAAINQPGSSLGRQPLGPEFLTALAECGI